MEERDNLINIEQESNSSIVRTVTNLDSTNQKGKSLCDYCGRTSLNSAKCIGRCLADSEY